jgi:predicted hydrolase (HD superfamily)
MTRDEALEILHEHVQNENLRKHAYAVEAAMRAYARKLGEDEEYWGVVGLLHDFEILRARGADEALIADIQAHARHTGVPRDTPVRQALFAVDELAGFIVACALVRPTGISDLKAKSVKKKMKDSSFAAAVSRDDIRDGAEELGVDLTEHIDFVIDAMREISGELGLE